MSRPKFVTDEDILRWSEIIDQDPNVPALLVASEVIREVCYAGLWLCEELDKLGCPDEMISRIQYTCGKLSFGRDTWEVHQKVLEEYKNNQLEFAQDPIEMN